MADIKISAMTAATSLNGDELIPIVQGGANKTATPNLLKSSFSLFYPTVNAFTDLPPAADHTGEIYIVLTSTGVWLINRKDAGLWYSNGAAWTRLGDVPSYFNTANLQIYDGTDNTKVVKFDVSTVNGIKTLIIPNAEGTLALLADIPATPAGGFAGLTALANKLDIDSDEIEFAIINSYRI
jgi:hypothetical protein